MISRILLFAAFLFLSACSKQLSKPFDLAKMERPYSESVGDAAKAQVWEISDQLTVIDKANDKLVWKDIHGEDYLLVSSWKADTTHYLNDPKTGFYNTGNYPIWVTVAPELPNLCQSRHFGRKEGLELRLKQLLGMPPDVEKNYFVEFWVRPKDLFRPCPDQEINDSSCQIAFPEGTPEEYINWVNGQRLASYYNPDWDANYPWTQLGYTYDWNPKNKSHVGLSEFIIAAQADVIVHQIYTTEEYCMPEK